MFIRFFPKENSSSVGYKEKEIWEVLEKDGMIPFVTSLVSLLLERIIITVIIIIIIIIITASVA
jgi:hypothetical protein